MGVHGGALKADWLHVILYYTNIKIHPKNIGRGFIIRCAEVSLLGLSLLIFIGLRAWLIGFRTLGSKILAALHPSVGQACETNMEAWCMVHH